MFFRDEKALIAIDGANLYATAKALGAEIDFKSLLNDLRAQTRVLRAFYYTAIVEEDSFVAIQPLIDWLAYNGFRVVTKPARHYIDSGGRRRVNGNMGIEIAVDAMELSRHYDHFVLFSGDGDFVSLVSALQRAGKRVTIASSLQTPKSMVSDDLRRQADHFLEITSLTSLGRERGHLCARGGLSEPYGHPDDDGEHRNDGGRHPAGEGEGAGCRGEVGFVILDRGRGLLRHGSGIGIADVLAVGVERDLRPLLAAGISSPKACWTQTRRNTRATATSWASGSSATLM